MSGRVNMTDDALTRIFEPDQPMSYQRLDHITMFTARAQQGYIFLAFTPPVAKRMGWNAVFIAEEYDGSVIESRHEWHYVGIQLASIAITKYVPIYWQEVHFCFTDHRGHDANLDLYRDMPMMFITPQQVMELPRRPCVETATWLGNVRKYLQEKPMIAKKFFKLPVEA